MGVRSIIDGRHGWPCEETGTKAKAWFETLALIEGPIMVLDKAETHDKAWRVMWGALPAFCDLKGRAWVEQQLDMHRGHFAQVMLNHALDQGSKPSLLIRPQDIAYAHQITLEELRAHGANRCGLTSINPETPEQTKMRKSESEALRRRRNGAKSQKDRTLTKDRKAYAAHHGISVYEVRKQMDAGTLTRDDLREPDALRKKAWRPNTYNDATDFSELVDAVVIQPATAATARAGGKTSQDGSRGVRPRSIFVRPAHLTVTIWSRSIPHSHPLAGENQEMMPATDIDFRGLDVQVHRLAA